MSGFRSLNNSTSKRVLNLLEPVKLTVSKVMIERVTVVKFRVNYRGGNGNTSNIEIVKSCQEFFGFELPSTLLSKRIAKFESICIIHDY